MKWITVAAFALALSVAPMTAWAEGGHEGHERHKGHDMKHEGHKGHEMKHEGHKGHDMKHDMGDSSKMFLKKKEIDGYTVTFHVMEATDGMRHGGSHNVMVKVERDGKLAEVRAANSKVIYPDGKEESKKLMKMGDWLMAGYDLDASGKHQVMVLFKSADGQKHFGGVFYP